MDESDIFRIERTLFFEQPDLRLRMTRFITLILLASVIATGGLLSDSVASVIGAMIVAPLMTPIMGMVVAVVTGSMPRFVRTFATVVLGVTLAILVGWLIAWLMPTGWDVTTSGQVMARTSPRLMDLLVALASGGAGAYALSRSDIADALPGVAIAISLVPPLNTVGILLAGGEGTLATGALVLFLTNFGAILLAGTVTFVLTGLASGVGRGPRELRNALIAIVLFVGLISIPLKANGNAIWEEARREDAALKIINEWLESTDWEIYQAEVDGSDLNLILAGDGTLPPADYVVAELREVMGPDMTVTTRILVVRKEELFGVQLTPEP